MTSEDVTIHVAPGSTTVDANGSGVVTGARELTGWEDVEITLRAESFPPTFRLTASSGIPGGRDAAMAHAGDSCFVRLGDDLAITGYLTSLTGEIDAGSHTVELIGAGKTQDLVSEINWDESRPYLNPTVDAIEMIASYFGIEVAALGDAATPRADGTPNVADYPIVLDFGMSAADYVNQITRIMGVLAYEDSAGRLVLSRAGTECASSGAVYGQNVLAMTIVNSMEGGFPT